MRLIRLLLVSILFTTIYCTTAQSADTFIRMASGPSGGSWYPLGAKIVQIFEDNIDGITTSNTSGGGISNIHAVQGGDAEIGWSYAHTTYNGFTGIGKFDEAQPDVRHFATLYPAMFQMAVRNDSNINSVHDMAAVNISPGKAKWTGTAFAETILNAHDISFDSIRSKGGTVHHASYTESVALMKDGHIDVFMAATSMPQASFLELEHNPGIRFIGLPKDKLTEIIEANPGYVAGLMPKGVYESVVEDIETLGIVTNMVVHKDLPNELVYNMCKIFWDNHATFAEVKDIWHKVKLADALKGAAIPIHPGAQKCYDELGVKD